MEQQQLHVVLFPAMAHGHMIPMLDMAKLFTSRGLKTTIIATPSFAHPITQAQNSGHRIDLIITKFPPNGSALPDDVVSLDQMTTPVLINLFLHAMELLQGPVETILQQLQPNCLISDVFFPWTADSAAKLGFPRLVFYGTSCFSRCVVDQMELHKPYKKVLSDSEPFLLPGLPHQLSFVRSQMAPLQLYDEIENEFAKLLKKMSESVKKAYGEVMNSFYELEPAYFDHFKNVLGKKAWHIGPLLLHTNAEAHRGKVSDLECLAWLDSKMPNTVVYVCFGSTVSFSEAQLHETAAGLEASNQDFIWVVRKSKNEDWSLAEFEEIVKGKGLIIRDWVPQVMILNHPAIGGFVTHSGWNSTLEGICAGVPLVTWPLFADQFWNEKLVTEVLGIGVCVGNKRWMRTESEGVGWEAVAKAVARIMVGEEAGEMRRRASCYKEMAKKAVEEGGSSYNALNDFIEELSSYVPPTKQDVVN